VIYALDFDGVICDSAYECLVTSREAFPHFCQELNLPVPRTDMPDDALAEHFCRLRYMARTAGEFWLILDRLYRGQTHIDPNGFERQARRNETKNALFEKNFFATRADHMSRDYGGWLGLHRLYPQFTDFWQALGHPDRVVIVTSKNQAPVRALLDHFQLDLGDDVIFAREAGLHKDEKIRAAASLKGTDPQYLLFVDDHLGNLQTVQPTGSPCYLALWGYCPPDLEEMPPGIVGLENLTELLSKERT